MSIKSWLREWLLESPSEDSAPPSAELLNSYEQDLAAIDENAAESALLDVLIQRDKIATALAGRPPSATTLQRLADLDGRLRKAHLPARMAGDAWDGWRKACNPAPDRWWWRLDEASTRSEEKRDYPLGCLAGFLLFVAFSLIADVIRRVWSGGVDSFSVMASTVAVMITGGLFTKQGRELVDWLMNRIRLPTRVRGETWLGAAGLVFIAALLLHLALPTIATYYNNHGYARLRSNDLNGAQRAFARAVSLNPVYADGYYNLADAYVEIGDYDQAQSLYTQALAADRGLDFAYNGLGHVLILQGEPENAVPILYTGLDRTESDVVRIALQTNLGRAYLNAGRLNEAEAVLNAALSLAPEEAAAHCALASTAEALEQSEAEIVFHWENCLRYAPGAPRGSELATMARAHLRALQEE